MYLDAISEGVEKGIRVFFWDKHVDFAPSSQSEIFVFTDNYNLSEQFGLPSQPTMRAAYFSHNSSFIRFKAQFMLAREILPLDWGVALGQCLDQDLGVIEKSGIIYKRHDAVHYLSFPWRITREVIGTESEYRPFYSKTAEKFYCEVGPVVDYNILRKLVKNLLVYAFNSLGLPLIRRKNQMDGKAYYSMRIDADGFSKSSVSAVLEVARVSKKRFHWFIDVYSWCKHGGIQSVKLLEKQNQDVQIHSFRHMTFLRYANNLLNMWTASAILRFQGIRSSAVVSPFGFYNTHFQKAMKNLKFKYTSEFGFNVNDVATFPDNDVANPLQIPTHNASITTLKLSNFTPEETFTHLEKQIVDLSSENGFAILYEHPILGIEKFGDRYIQLLQSLDTRLQYVSIDDYAEIVKSNYQGLVGELFDREGAGSLIRYSWYLGGANDKLSAGDGDEWIPYEKISSETRLQLKERKLTFETYFTKEYHAKFVKWVLFWYIRSLATAVYGSLREKIK